MLALMKRIWRGWKGFAHSLVKGQTWVLMAFVYFFAMGPVSFFIKLDRKRRLDRGPADPQAPTYGRRLEPQQVDVRRAQRPW